MSFIKPDDHNTYTFIDKKTKDQIIKEHTFYWIPKMYKNPISFRFIIASPVCSIEPLSKDITLIFKLFYEKVEIYHTKRKVWSGIKTFWTIQNSYPVISSINKLNKRKAAKSMSIFYFSMLYTKIPHDKLFVLNEITDFAFKGGTRDYITVYK